MSALADQIDNCPMLHTSQRTHRWHADIHAGIQASAGYQARLLWHDPGRAGQALFSAGRFVSFEFYFSWRAASKTAVHENDGRVVFSGMPVMRQLDSLSTSPFQNRISMQTQNPIQELPPSYCFAGDYRLHCFADFDGAKKPTSSVFASAWAPARPRCKKSNRVGGSL